MISEIDVRRTLFRFQRKDYKRLFDDWGSVKNAVAPENLERASKKDAISSVLSKVKENRFNKNDIRHLDLIYTYYHSRNKVWQVYELDNVEDEFESVPNTADEFREKLQLELSAFFTCSISVMMFGKAFWIRVEVGSNKRRKLQSSVSYAVHFPGTRFLVMAGLKASNGKYSLQAFANTLDCTDIVEMELRGRCVSSLTQLAINKDYRGKSEIPPSVTDKIPRKRTASDSDLDCQIICENEVQYNKRNALLEDNFGPFIQPTLEKVEYVLETRFKGTRYAPGMGNSDDLFKCRVRFDGPSVLEGLRELGEAGISEIPMPKHMSKISSLGKSIILLRDKKPLQNSQSQNTE